MGGESQHARLKGRFDRCKLVVVQGNPLGVEIDVSTSVSVLETSGRFQEFVRHLWGAMSIFGETSCKTSLSQTCTPKLSAEVLWHHDGAEDSTRSSDEGGLDTDGTDSDEDFPTPTCTPAAFEDELGNAAPQSAQEA